MNKECKMKSNFEMVKEFHEVYGQEKNDSVSIDAIKTFKNLRLSLIEEEHHEIEKELWTVNPDPVAVAKELTDLLYVVYGTGVTFGIDLDKCFSEVHKSNMSKLGEDGKPIYRNDGKVLKGPNYKPVDLKRVLYTDE